MAEVTIADYVTPLVYVLTALTIAIALFHHSHERIRGESVANSLLSYVWGKRTSIDNKIC
jgi:hypothetical protein